MLATLFCIANGYYFMHPLSQVSLTEVAIKLVSRELYRPVKKLKRYAAQVLQENRISDLVPLCIPLVT